MIPERGGDVTGAFTGCGSVVSHRRWNDSWLSNEHEVDDETGPYPLAEAA